MLMYIIYIWSVLGSKVGARQVGSWFLKMKHRPNMICIVWSTVTRLLLDWYCSATPSKKKHCRLAERINPMLHSEPITLIKPVNALVQVVQPHILGGPDVSVRSPPPQSSGLPHQAPEVTGLYCHRAFHGPSLVRTFSWGTKPPFQSSALRSDLGTRTSWYTGCYHINMAIEKAKIVGRLWESHLLYLIKWS